MPNCNTDNWLQIHSAWLQILEAPTQYHRWRCYRYSRRSLEARIGNLHDTGVLVEVNFLDGHGRHLWEQDPPDGVHDGGIVADHVKLHVHALRIYPIRQLWRYKKIKGSDVAGSRSGGLIQIRIHLYKKRLRIYEIIRLKNFEKFFFSFLLKWYKDKKFVYRYSSSITLKK